MENVNRKQQKKNTGNKQYGEREACQYRTEAKTNEKEQGKGHRISFFFGGEEERESNTDRQQEERK